MIWQTTIRATLTVMCLAARAVVVARPTVPVVDHHGRTHSV